MFQFIERIVQVEVTMLALKTWMKKSTYITCIITYARDFFFGFILDSIRCVLWEIDSEALLFNAYFFGGRA